MNTATGLSYQDVFDGAAKVREWIKDDNFDAKGIPDLETLLLSQTTPQLIRHVRFVHRATTEYQTKIVPQGRNNRNRWYGTEYSIHPLRRQAFKKVLAKNEAFLVIRVFYFFWPEHPMLPL